GTAINSRSKIPNPISTAAITTTATIERSTVQRIVDIISTKSECHDARFKNANWTASQLNESTTVSWFQQSSLTNHSKSERREHECHDARPVPLLFPTQTPLVRKFEADEDLLKTFRKVEINIPLVDAIKRFPSMSNSSRNYAYIRGRR
ncbi:hypothetical protein CR513_16660, partial [Mucuna pruriens]